MEEQLMNKLIDERDYMKNSGLRTAIAISTTASHSAPFLVLPRRSADGIALSSFMINDEKLLADTLAFFDGFVHDMLIDTEPKQKIQLLDIAERTVHNSRVITMKPNDVTLESCTLLLHHKFGAQLAEKRILILGTGNLAGKMALRLAESGACVHVAGRSITKVETLLAGLNLMLPSYAIRIKPFTQSTEQADAVISFISGMWEDEDALQHAIGPETLLIDGGIGNFSSRFIEAMLDKGIQMTRLDTRIALPYQLLGSHSYVESFFDEIYGTGEIAGVPVAAGGFVGPYGTVIVDKIKSPNQVIGIADGKGGVIRDGSIEASGQRAADKVKETITARD